MSCTIAIQHCAALLCVTALAILVFWKTDQLSHYSIGQLKFISPANSYIHTLPIHSAICVYTYLDVYIHTWHVPVHNEWKLQRKILMCLCCCITYVTVSAITIPNGTFGISRTFWNIEATVVLLCCVLVMLDVQHN